MRSVTDHLHISDTCKPKLHLAWRVGVPFFGRSILPIVNRRQSPGQVHFNKGNVSSTFHIVMPLSRSCVNHRSYLFLSCPTLRAAGIILSAILRAILARFILVNRVMMMIALAIASMIMMLPISDVDGQDLTARKLNRASIKELSAPLTSQLKCPIYYCRYLCYLNSSFIVHTFPLPHEKNALCRLVEVFTMI